MHQCIALTIYEVHVCDLREKRAKISEILLKKTQCHTDSCCERKSPSIGITRNYKISDISL